MVAVENQRLRDEIERILSSADVETTASAAQSQLEALTFGELSPRSNDIPRCVVLSSRKLSRLALKAPARLRFIGQHACILVAIEKETPRQILEAVRMAEEGVASIEDIDKAVKLGLNYPMGPFELMDLTGIDIAHHVADYLYKELSKESKWSIPVQMKSMIRAGKLGRKTGGGWYKY